MFVLIFATYSAYTQDNIVFNIGLLDFGGGVNIPVVKKYPTEGHFSLISVGIEDRKRNIGLGFNPCMIYTPLPEELGFNNKVNGNFFNLNVYKNFINKDLSDNLIFYLGPYSSVNYMFYYDAFQWDKFIFSAGMQLGIRQKFNKINFNIWSLETGYHNINGNSKFYAGIRIDIAAVSFLRFLAWLNS